MAFSVVVVMTFAFLWTTTFASILTLWLCNPRHSSGLAREMRLYGVRESMGHRTLPSVNKAWFILFYIVGTVALRSLTTREREWQYLYLLRAQCGRRLSEVIVLQMQRTGSMGAFHLVFGILYYAGLGSICTSSSEQDSTLTITVVAIYSILGLIQSLIHCLYALEKARGSTTYTNVVSFPLSRVKNVHYLSEFLIYAFSFQCTRTSAAASNAIWVLVLVMTQSHK